MEEGMDERMEDKTKRERALGRKGIESEEKDKRRERERER